MSPSPLTARNPVFRVLYSGNLGRVHDFEGLARAIPLTPGSILWTICGDGPQKKNIPAEADWLPAVSWAQYPELMARANAHLITQRSEFCGMVVPSKIYDAAASGRPLLFAGPAASECALAIREHEMGLVVPDRDGKALAEAATFLAMHPELCRKMGQRAADFGRAHRLQNTGPVWADLLAGVHG